MLYPIDQKLKEFPFRRFPSLCAAGISPDELPVRNLDNVRQMIADYKAKFVRLMMPKFKLPHYQRSEFGPLVNTDEALEGIPECYRRRVTSKRAPLRIGINLSRQSGSSEQTAIRGAAILALKQLCASRGQSTICEVAYGNGLMYRYSHESRCCHVRIGLPMPTEDILTRVCCSNSSIGAVGHKHIAPHDMGKHWHGVYRFYEWEKHWKQKEYDFVLDRIETCDSEQEYNRVLEQLKQFGVMK